MYRRRLPRESSRCLEYRARVRESHDAVGHEHLQHVRAVERQMHVQIPQAGDQIFSMPVHDASADGSPGRVRRSDGYDTAVCNQNRVIALWRRTGRVDHGDIGNR